MHKKSMIKDVLVVAIGNFIVACAVAFLILPNSILTGGVSGVAVALEPVFHIEPVWMINGLTVGLFLIGALLLGKEFALKTVVSAVVYPMFTTVLTMAAESFPPETFLLPEYLASIYSGVLTGLGLGIVFRVDASTGGMDIPALLLHKYFHVPSGNAVMLIDALTVLLGIFTYGLEAVLVGVISVFVSGQVINKTVVLGSQHAKNVMIISPEWDAIRKYLLTKVDRGVTVLSGTGGYTGRERPVLMCIVDQKQYPKLEQEVKELDPAAFIIVSDVHEIHGSGFTFADGTLNRLSENTGPIWKS